MGPNLGGPLKENMYSPLRGEGGGLECARGMPRVSARAGNDQPDADAWNGPSRFRPIENAFNHLCSCPDYADLLFFFFHDESVAISNAIPKRLDVVLSIKQHLLRSLVVYL